MDYQKDYASIKEKRLKGLWISYDAIYDLIQELDKRVFDISILGYSSNKKAIHKISLGTGKIKILLWSQMHGDESTATKVFFDLFNLFTIHKNTVFIKTLLKECQLVFIPMLNPEGATLFTRENAMGIDLNRDAMVLKTPEAKILHNVANEFKPDYAFNLHDQDSYYSTEGSAKPASFSFLAPASDALRTVTKNRGKAMRLIAGMNQYIQKVIPQQVGRYKDTYCDTCFGDQIQKLGIATILIESGYYPGDEKREITRSLHFSLLLQAFSIIIEKKSYATVSYFSIPENLRNYYDLRLNNCLYNNKIQDIGIRFIYKVKDGKLKKLIDFNDIIFGESLETKLFHHTIEASEKDLMDFSW